MRRAALAAVSALVAVVLVVGVPSAASAADPIPGPVVDIPELPSVATKRAGTTSPMQTQALVDLWRIMSGKGTAAPGSVVPVGKPPTVPLTGTQLMTRSGGAAGAVVTGFGVGWALGQGGLVLYAQATGQSYEDLICATPDWYQGASSFLMMGVVPGCKATVSVVNPDVVPGFGPVSYSGWTVTYKGTFHQTTFGGWDIFCYTLSSETRPAGVGTQMQTSQGWQGAGPSYQAECPSATPYGIPVANNTWNVTGPVSPAVRITRTQNGTTTVVATMQESTADPVRKPRCRITWRDGSTTSAYGSNYTEATGINMSSAGVGCEQAYVSKPGGGPALLPSRIQIDSEDEGGVITTISDLEVPDYTEPQKQAMFQPGNGRGLVLEKVVNGVTYSCMTWATDCAQWWTATSNGTTEGPYRCTFAGQPVSIGECGPYRHTFDTKTNTPTITDPTTGSEVGWSAQPSTGNSISPGTGPGTGANPADACFETGWAEVANPIDWVLVPIKCALVWAFVPRQSAVDATLGRLPDAVEASNVGPAFGALASLGAAFDAGVGCGGLPFHLEGFGVTLVHANLLASCDEPAAGIAATVKTVLTFVIIAGGFLAVLRYLGAVFGFIGFGRARADQGSGKSGVSFD